MATPAHSRQFEYAYGALRPRQGRTPITDGRFLALIVFLTLMFRLAVFGVLMATNAVEVMRLAPDSARYHSEGILIAAQMARGHFNWPEWIDNGYFQFTGFVYWLAGPKQWVMQLINILVGSVTVVPLFYVMKNCVDDVITQRMYAVLVAFFPTLVWWSVLHMKDAISTIGVVLIVYALFMFRIRPQLGAILGYLIGMAFLLTTRTYLFFVTAMLTAPALLLFPYRPQRHTFRILLIAVLAGLLPMFLGYGYYGLTSIVESRYFDIDYINRVRVDMGDHGSGRIFTGDVHIWGESLSADVAAAAKTLFSVFVPVNPFAITSTRQAMALPVVIAMVLLLFPMGKGVRYAWRVRSLIAPVGVITIAFLAVYISGTTNVGALFRWTTQIMPMLMMLVAVGLVGRPDHVLYGVAQRVLPPRRV